MGYLHMSTLVVLVYIYSTRFYEPDNWTNTNDNGFITIAKLTIMKQTTPHWITECARQFPEEVTSDILNEEDADMCKRPFSVCGCDELAASETDDAGWHTELAVFGPDDFGIPGRRRRQYTSSVREIRYSWNQDVSFKDMKMFHGF